MRAWSGRGDLQRQFLQNVANFRNLRGIALRQFAAFQIQAVFQPDANAAAHQGAHCDHAGLVLARTQNGQIIVIAKQPVRRLLHVHQVFRIRTNAAQNAKDALDQERRLDDAFAHEIVERIEMPDVIAFELETRSEVASQFCGNLLDLLEGVAGDDIVGLRQIVFFPGKFELFRPCRRRQTRRNSSNPYSMNKARAWPGAARPAGHRSTSPCRHQS